MFVIVTSKRLFYKYTLLFLKYFPARHLTVCGLSPFIRTGLRNPELRPACFNLTTKAVRPTPVLSSATTGKNQ